MAVSRAVCLRNEYGQRGQERRIGGNSARFNQVDICGSKVKMKAVALDIVAGVRHAHSLRRDAAGLNGYGYVGITLDAFAFSSAYTLD